MRFTFALLILALLIRPALAVDAPRLVAILPLDASGAKLDDATGKGLEESIRTAAGDHLSKFGYTVLTGENTLRLLAENNIDTTKSCDATCALSAARELKAQLFISGSISQNEGDYLAVVCLFDPKSGQQLASTKLKGKKVKDLCAQFDTQVAPFFASAPRERSTVDEETLAPGQIGLGLNGPLVGNPDNERLGSLAARGGGSGGGGTGLGIGGLGSHGTRRRRAGSTDFDLGGKLKPTKLIPGRVTAMGELRADTIGRIVRRHWRDAKHCYEKELPKNLNLSGTVAVYFEIGKAGEVTTVRMMETSLHDDDVEQCLVGLIRSLKFPTPRGGGVVNVRYPFIFQVQQ